MSDSELAAMALELETTQTVLLTKECTPIRVRFGGKQVSGVDKPVIYRASSKGELRVAGQPEIIHPPRDSKSLPVI